MGGAGFAEQETFEVAAIPLRSRSLTLRTENSISSKAIPMNSIRSANGAEVANGVVVSLSGSLSAFVGCLALPPTFSLSLPN